MEQAHAPRSLTQPSPEAKTALVVLDFGGGFFFAQPKSTAWNAFSLAQKQRFHTLLFPEGVVFDQGKCRTAKTTLILQLKTSLHEGEMFLVNHLRVSWNQLVEEMRGWQELRQQLPVLVAV